MIGKTMSSVTTETVLQTLRNIPDPQSGIDIVSRGMIQGLTIRDGHVSFAVEVDAKDGNAREPLRQACEKAVLSLSGVDRKSVV